MPLTVVADTQQEIDHLLSFVASTSCQYERNGTYYSGKEARDHINLKYEYYQSKIKTTEGFIKFSATKSNLSGEKYRIHCANKGVESTEEWLLSELQRYRKTFTPNE